MLDLSKYIDHTLLRLDAKKEDIEKLCKEAIAHNFKGVCVNSNFIPLIAKLLEGKKTIPIATVGFPLGAMVSSAKAFEAKEAISLGAKEIDMVMNIGALKDKDYNKVFFDIKNVVDEVKPFPVKVIIETSLLEKEEKIIACILSQVANAAFVKTSSGFGKGGASVEDIILMKSVLGNGMKIKASGGINTKQKAEEMIKNGADRIGSSASLKIIGVNL